MAKKAKAPETFRVLSFHSEGVKRLKVVDITTPDANLVEITGENDQGKSSLLDALEWALRSKKAADQPDPINHSADKAQTIVELGDDVPALTLTRTFTRREDGSIKNELKLESADGGRFDKAQSILDAIVGRIGVDPLLFAHMAPRDQFDVMREFVPDFDFDASARLDKRDYDTRTERNREASIFANQAAGITISEAPAERINESDLIADMQSVGQRNEQIDQAIAERQRAAEKLASLAALVGEKVNEAAVLRNRANALDMEADTLRREREALENKLRSAPPLPEKTSVDEIAAELEAARQHNAAIDRADVAKRTKAELEAKAKAAQEASAALTAAMEERAKERKLAIEAARMPIPGIDLREGVVFLDDVPFVQAAMSKKIRASVAIAAALNPQLRVMFVRDGDKLDRKSFEMLRDVAREFDVQLWIETVESDRPDAVIIEDGRVAS